MNDRVYGSRLERVRDHDPVPQIPFDELGGGLDGCAMPVLEAVEGGDLMPFLDEALHHHAPDISGRAGDEHMHLLELWAVAPPLHDACAWGGG